MSNGWQYVIPGYGFVFAVLGTYSFWLIRRGKKLAQQIPEERRRFLD